jgi:hypothetical protein
LEKQNPTFPLSFHFISMPIYLTIEANGRKPWAKNNQDDTSDIEGVLYGGRGRRVRGGGMRIANEIELP